MDNEAFQAHLLNGEKLLWTGRPQVSYFQFIRSKRESFQLWAFLILVATGFVLGLTNSPEFPPALNLVILITLPLSISGLWLYYWLAKHRDLQRTVVYGVTDQRLLTLATNGLYAIPINAIVSIYKDQNTPSLGTLIFHTPQPPPAHLNGRLQGLLFYHITNVNAVYKLVFEQQNHQLPEYIQGLDNTFNLELIEDEKVLWAGRPQLSAWQMIRSKVIALVGFVVIAGFIMVYFPTLTTVIILALALLLPILGLALYLDWRQKAFHDDLRHTLYAVTNRRILVRIKEREIAGSLQFITTISKIPVHKTIGTLLIFMSGLENCYDFRNINDVEYVYELLNRLTSTLEKKFGALS